LPILRQQESADAVVRVQREEWIGIIAQYRIFRRMWLLAIRMRLSLKSTAKSLFFVTKAAVRLAL
jgi:hypothetical protein